MSARLANNDGALDPMNSTGPWHGRVLPYSPMRIRAQYPPTQNMLMQGAATGGDVGATLGTVDSQNPSIWISSATASADGSVVADATAYRGSNVLQFGIPASTPPTPLSNARIFYALNPSFVPGKPYTFQAQIRNVTASTSLTVAPFFGWYGPDVTGANATYNVGSSVTLTGSATAPWTSVTYTATAPTSGVYGMFAGVLVTATSPASAVNLQADALQLEKGSTATAFTVPGVSYPMYSGFVERWPSKWDFGGTYGVVEPTAVDAFALLSQRQLNDPLTQEIYNHTPNFIYPLGDPQGVSYFTDATGNHGPASIGVSAYGAGSLTAGNKIQSATAGGTFLSSNTVVTIANQYPGTTTVGAASFVDLTYGGIRGPKDPGNWTRILAFRYTGPVPASGASAVMWTAFDGQRSNNYPSGSRIEIGIDSNGHVYCQVRGSNGTNVYGNNTNVNVCDGNWHLAIISYAYTVGFGVAVDNANISYFGGYSSATNPTGLISDSVGGWVDPGTGNGTVYNYQGDIAYAAEFTGFFFANDVTNIYNAWRNAFAGDSTDQRYARILRWAGYTGATDIAAGQTKSMGPAKVAGQDALSALNDVVQTENGVHYTSTSGTLTFRGRSTRYNSTTPLYTFGENTAAGEWPYENVELDFDSTHLANLVAVTQPSTGQTFTAADATSQTNFFPRSMSRTVNSANALECQDAANSFLSRYKNPLTRVQSIKLHPSANPGLWPVCLSLELNQRVRIMRRPFGAPAIQVDCFIEHIQWDLDDQNEASVTLQCSPVDATPYGLFASFHTALSVQASSGASSITIANGADNTNPAAAQIGPGQQLVLEPGTANSETVTVQSVGATSAGWTTCVIALTANLTKTHAANSVVCEPLPSGVTDPTTYDASAKFDSAAFSY
ncbi:hypothetical protein [Kitasatospora cathayae]|uniref:Uncharacterized protein n=1 Tax=Kitasatospora cathayae TaxID=3004092 RepID=A0ABY7Q3E7_9ACTN|nr:hypothetical protein [Kitasatospora sp. HUAS 3-15]WBP87037.1 hypothetical protein O1G21_15085 [Kitasatospora sp. HUAS 3-15]